MTLTMTLMALQVRFDACDGFEFTQEMCVFDMCNIGLYHCWVYDAHKEPDVHAAMGRRHYNEVRCSVAAPHRLQLTRFAQAVLALFNSLDAAPSPPAPAPAPAPAANADGACDAGEGGGEGGEQLQHMLQRASLCDDVAGQAVVAAPAAVVVQSNDEHVAAGDSAAAGGEEQGGSGLMSAAAAGARARIREWMQVAHVACDVRVTCSIFKCFNAP
jgi:hypothetical protein